MFTTATDANKVMSQGLIVKYDAEPVLHVANNVSYTVAWKLTRTATQSYSYVGMTKAAAESCSETLRTNFTRKYMDFECDVVENEKDALKPNVIISPAFVWKCSTAIAPTHTDGEMYQIDISVSDVDVVYTTDQVTDAADLEGLFQAAAARDIPAGTDHIEIVTASWDSTSSIISIRYSQSISGYNKINLKADVWNYNTSQWESVNLSSVHDDSATISNVTSNKKFRLSYDSGRVKSEAYKTTDNPVPIIEITNATVFVGEPEVFIMSSTYSYFTTKNNYSFDVKMKGSVSPSNLYLSLTYGGGGSDKFKLLTKIDASQRNPVSVDEDGWCHYKFDLVAEGISNDVVAMFYNLESQVFGHYQSNQFAVIRENYINITSITANANRQAVVEFETNIPSTRMNASGITLYEWSIMGSQRRTSGSYSLIGLNIGSLEQLGENSWRYTSSVNEAMYIDSYGDVCRTTCLGEFALGFKDDLGSSYSTGYQMTWPEMSQTIINVSFSHNYTEAGANTFTPSLGPVKLFSKIRFCSSSGSSNAGKLPIYDTHGVPIASEDIVTVTSPGDGRVAADATATWTTKLKTGATPFVTPTTVLCRLIGAFSEIPNNFIGGVGSTLYQKVKQVSISGYTPTIGSSVFSGISIVQFVDLTCDEVRALTNYPFGMTAGAIIVCKDGSINLNAITIDYSGTAANNTVSLGAIHTDGPSTVYIDWDDGSAVGEHTTSSEPFDVTGVTHTYAATGKHLIRIYGENIVMLKNLNGGAFVQCSNAVINEVQIPATLSAFSNLSFYKIGCKVSFQGNASFDLSVFGTDQSSTDDEIVFYGDLSTITNDAFRYTGGAQPDITFKNKTMAQVRALANYPWQLSLGTEIHCTDGDIVVGE